MAIDILVTKGAVTASLATGYTLSKLLSDIISNYGSLILGLLVLKTGDIDLNM